MYVVAQYSVAHNKIISSSLVIFAFYALFLFLMNELNLERRNELFNLEIFCFANLNRQKVNVISTNKAQCM